MTKEDLIKEAEEGYIKRIRRVGVMGNYRNQTYNDGYLDGAEPREKQIAELGQLIKTQDRKLRQQSKECDKAINRVEILAKENAELKEQNIKDCENFNKTMKEIKEQWNKEHYQLTKAKEIISEWEDSFCCGADYLYLGNKGEELRIKSQKFLNSKVEK